MTQYRLVSIEDAAGWRQALGTVPHSYWHTWEACNALRMGTGDEMFLFVCSEDRGNALAILPFAERSWRGSIDIYTPAGFSGFASCGETAGVRADWDELVRRRGYVCGYFALHPVFANAGLHSGIASRGELFVLDLGLGAQCVVDGFDADTKRVHRLFAAAGLKPIVDKASLAPFVLAHYSEFMESVGARPDSIWRSDTLAQICADPSVEMFGAADADGICSVSLFGRTPHCSEYLASVRVRDGRRLGSFLVEAAVRRFAEEGVPWLHLGGGVRSGDAIARSKLRYGPSRVPFVVAQEVYEQEAYDRLLRDAGQATNERTQYFPGYRR